MLYVYTAVSHRSAPVWGVSEVIVPRPVVVVVGPTSPPVAVVVVVGGVVVPAAVLVAVVAAVVVMVVTAVVVVVVVVVRAVPVAVRGVNLVQAVRLAEERGREKRMKIMLHEIVTWS